MTDITAVITQAKHGNYPSNWKVYPGTGDYGCANLMKIFAIGGFLIIFILAIISIIGGNLLGILEMLIFFGIICGICGIVARKWRIEAAAGLNSVLVLLPDGVVQCRAGNINNPGWLSFPYIKNLELVMETEVSGNEDSISTYHYYWLDVYGHDGSYSKFRVWDGFGDPEFLSKTIIAAYNHYWNQN